ncbi:MAG: hypothetical protein FH753_17725 [Firmicutes bacterium]|nr:hypothetical protein [Bacillota bacterium]
MKELKNTRAIVILAGIVGLLFAPFMYLGAGFSADYASHTWWTVLNTLTLLEIVGTISLIVLGVRLKKENKKTTGIICFIVFGFFIILSISLLNLLPCIPAILLAWAGVSCFRN